MAAQSSERRKGQPAARAPYTKSSPSSPCAEQLPRVCLLAESAVDAARDVPGKLLQLLYRIIQDWACLEDRPFNERDGTVHGAEPRSPFDHPNRSNNQTI